MANRYQRQQERYFKQRTYDKVENYKVISKAAEKRIDKAIKEGKTPAQIAKREAEISANYAKTAARTDATRVENLARADAMTEIANMGVMMGKKWNTIMDGKQRDTHGAIDGEEQFHDDPYSIGGLFPGDPNLPPSEPAAQAAQFPEGVGVVAAYTGSQHTLPASHQIRKAAVNRLQPLRGQTADGCRQGSNTHYGPSSSMM